MVSHPPESTSLAQHYTNTLWLTCCLYPTNTKHCMTLIDCWTNVVPTFNKCHTMFCVCWVFWCQPLPQPTLGCLPSADPLLGLCCRKWANVNPIIVNVSFLLGWDLSYCVAFIASYRTLYCCRYWTLYFFPDTLPVIASHDVHWDCIFSAW